jgi:hypothetical protein
LSLAANATHGKQRTVGDYKRGYGIAVRNALIEADDSVGLMKLLRCSMRTVEVFTEEARAAVAAAQKKARDAQIVAAMDRGELVRETADTYLMPIPMPLAPCGRPAFRCRLKATVPSRRF